jgi:RHS repeat-associated protein
LAATGSAGLVASGALPAKNSDANYNDCPGKVLVTGLRGETSYRVVISGTFGWASGSTGDAQFTLTPSVGRVNWIYFDGGAVAANNLQSGLPDPNQTYTFTWNTLPSRTALELYIGDSRHSDNTGSLEFEIFFDGNAIPGRSILSTNNGVKFGPAHGAVAAEMLESGMTCYACAQAGVGDPINTNTGGFDFTTVDLSLSTLAGPLVFQRTYSSLAVTTYLTSPLGYGWTDNQDTRLIFPGDPLGQPNIVWFKARSANQFRFDITSTLGITSYIPFAGVLASLTYTTTPTTVYTLTTPGQSVYAFNSSGQLTQWSDPQGHAMNYSYDGSNRPITVTEPLSGRFLAISYNGSGQVTSVRDSASRQLSFAYSLTTGDLITATDVLGQNWTYVYSGTTHLLTDMFDPRSVKVFHTDYDGQGRAWRQYDALNANPAVQIAYNVDGTTVITDSRGITTTHFYDGRNTLAANAMPLGATITKSYDGNFRPATILDPLQHPVTLTWSNTNANLNQAINALSQTTQLSYDNLNNLTQTVDARSQPTNFSYSGTLLTVKTDALAHTALYTYTTGADAPIPVGLLKASSDPLGRTTAYQYDSLGQMVRMTDTAGIVTRYSYDNLGRVLTTTSDVGTALEQITVEAYDAAGRATKSTRNYTSTTGTQNYAAGGSIYNQVTSYSYDQVGNQTLVTDTLNHVTRTDFDALNRPVTVTVNYIVSASGPDLNIQAVTQYDANGNVVSVTHYAGTAQARTTATLYDALNRPISTTANFTGSGVFSAAFPDQNVTTLTAYDVAGNVISTTQFYGSSQARTTTTYYDVLNRPVLMMVNATGGSGADQNIQSLTRYDENGNVISTTQYANLPSLARTSLTQYDPVNRPVTVTTNSSGASGTDQNLQTVTAYDSAGQVISVTQGFGTGLARTTYTQYDAAGRPVTVTSSYDGSGVAGVARNLVQVTVYGSAGERAATTERRVYPDGSTTWITTTYSYNNLGQLIQTTYPLTNGVVAITAQTYDPLGRVITTTDELGRKTYTQFDALGRPVTVTVNYVDGAFNPAKTDEDLITVTNYDAAGNRIAAKDPNSVVTQYQYDLLNRLTAVTENYVLSGPTTPITNVLTVYTYTVAGGLANSQDGRGKVNSSTFDLLDRQVSATDPLAHTTVYTYNEAGDRIALLDPNGQVTNYAYDLLDRQTAITYPAGTPNVTFAYDVLSQHTTMTDGTGTTTWTFDAVGRPITITQPSVGNVGYGYDSAGDRTRLSYPDGKVVTYTYDLGARMASVTDWQGKTTGYNYNAVGQPITVTLPNGVTSRYSYDNAGRLAVLSQATLTQTLAVFTYTVDAVGNRTKVAEGTLITVTNSSSVSHGAISSSAVAANGTRGSVTALVGGNAILSFTHIRQTPSYVLSRATITYTYDPLYRLTAANYNTGQVYTYTYDAVGNRLGDGAPARINVYTYDDANRLATINGTATYNWDNNGNLLFDGAFNYIYDATNRLTEGSPYHGPGSTTYDYTYTGLGDLEHTLVTVCVGISCSYTPITMTLDLASGLTQNLADGTNTYLYGNDRIAQYAGVSAQYFLDDAFGSVRQLANGSGVITLARSYQPYGSVLSSVGAGTTSYGFTGEWTDNPTGLVDLRSRWYVPGQGRFLTKDTWANSQNPQSLNAWAYTNGNPTNYTDPSGQRPYCGDSPEERASCAIGFLDPPSVTSYDQNTPPRHITWFPSESLPPAVIVGVDPGTYQAQYSIHKGWFGLCGEVALAAVLASTYPGLTANDVVQAFIDNVNPEPNTTDQVQLAKLVNNVYGDYWSTDASKNYWTDYIPGNVAPWTLHGHALLADSLKAWLGNSQYPLIGVMIDATSGTSSEGRVQLTGAVHWVVLTGVSNEWDRSSDTASASSPWNWVRIFNPFNDDTEYYWWRDFIDAWMADGNMMLLVSHR